MPRDAVLSMDRRAEERAVDLASQARGERGRPPAWGGGAARRDGPQRGEDLAVGRLERV
jgi:hypothetical protein